MTFDEQKVRRILKQTILDSVPNLVDTMVEELRAAGVEIESKPIGKQETLIEWASDSGYSDD